MLLHCQACVLPVLRVDDVISSNYRTMTGRAYLAAIVSNVESASDAYEALYTTGQYTVRNVACAGCKTRLGVMYEDCADRHNAHKIGKYLLGQRLPHARKPRIFGIVEVLCPVFLCVLARRDAYHADDDR